MNCHDIKSEPYRQTLLEKFTTPTYKRNKNILKQDTQTYIKVINQILLQTIVGVVWGGVRVGVKRSLRREPPCIFYIFNS